MLCTLPESYKSHWHEHLNKVVHAYNCSRNDATGYSRFYLLFGRHPQLPIDLIFSIDLSTKHQSYPQYVSTWKTAMENAYKLASKKSQESGAWAKEYYDRKLHSSVLLPNDHVLVRNLSERVGPGNYEHTGKTIYTVLSNKEVLTHLYMRLNLRQVLALHVYFIEIYFYYHVILFLWTLTFQRRCLFQSKSLNRFPLGGKGSSNVSYLHV